MSARFAEHDASAGGNAPLDVRIDPLSERSLDAVARLFAQREGVSLERARQTWRRAWDRRDEPGAKTTFVASALHDESVAGFGSVKHSVTEPAPDARSSCPTGWYLAGVVVDAEARRRGVASRLVRHRLDWLAERGVTECFYVANDQNRPTIALHERFGFALIARDVELPGVTFEGGAGLLFRVVAPVSGSSARSSASRARTARAGSTPASATTSKPCSRRRASASSSSTSPPRSSPRRSSWRRWRTTGGASRIGLL